MAAFFRIYLSVGVLARARFCCDYTLSSCTKVHDTLSGTGIKADRVRKVAKATALRRKRVLLKSSNFMDLAVHSFMVSNNIPNAQSSSSFLRLLVLRSPL